MTRLPGLIRQMGRALAGLAAAAVLLAGVPYLLLRLAGSPLPHRLPSWPQVRGFLASPLSDGAITHGLADVGWVLWALLAVCVLIEAAAALTGRPAPRLPGLGPVQALAASLLGATLIGALPAGLASAGAATLPAGLAARTVAASPLRRGQPATTAADVAAPSAGASHQAAGPYRPRTYRVVAGDDLWSIAERVLGNGDQWRQLYQLNKGKPQPGGGALTSPQLIYPGWVLLLPPPAWHHEPAAPARPRHPAQPAHHSSPPAPPHPAPGRPAPSQHHPPSPHHQPARQGRGGLPVAVHLPSGALIGISVAVAVAAAVVLARIQRRRRYRPGLAASPPAEPPLPEVITALRRAARPPIPPGDDLSADEPPGEDPYLDPYQPGDADPDTGEPETASSRPGPAARREPGFVPAPPPAQTAGAHPRPPAARPAALPPLLPAGGPDLDLYATGGEPDALAPPGADGQPATASVPEGPPGADGTGVPPSPGYPAVISLGVRGDSPASLDIAALGGLGLTGPGAADAARAILATLLTQTPPGQPGLPAEVILPAADAASLLPGQDTTGIAGLSVPASAEDALAQMEAALLRQARTIQTAGPDSPPPAGPQTALIATCSTGLSARLRAITDAGRGLGVTAVVLGTWPAGITCQVAADGLVTTATPAQQGLDGLRLFHLGGPDATAIIGLLREAHGACLTGPSALDGPAAVPAPDAPPAGPPTGTGHHRPAPAPAGPPAPALSAGPAAGQGSSPGQEPATGPDRPAASSAARPVPPVRLDLLGPLRITAGGQEVSSGMRKARELLALLAVHRDGITGEAINEALWPGLDPSRATRQRNLALRKTRELLRGATGLAEAMWVLLSAGRYQLDPGLITADLWQFHDALHQAQHTADPGQQLAACQHAAGLYRGELADGAGYEWAEPAAETTRHLALDAWAKIADLLQARDPAQALATLETAVRHDPYNEFLYQRIMRLQADTGHPDAVRRTLSLLESRLTDLGVTPGTQTRQLAATLLSAPIRPYLRSVDR